MKFLYTTLLSLIAFVAVTAQQLSPSVIASAGSSFQSSEFSLDYTLGETFITTLTNGQNTLTQGFHQPQAGVIVEGCTAVEACNYNPDATVEDGSCILAGEPCDDGNPASLDDVWTADCVCAGSIAGCTFPAACNFNPDAAVEDASCLFTGDACDDQNASTILDAIGADCVCEGQLVVEGCVAIAACNYNPNANIDNATCVFPGEACNDADATTINDLLGVDCVCAGTPVNEQEGCIDILACNYNPDAAINDGSCVFIGDVCSDGNAATINDVYTVDCLCEGEIISEISGCTFPDACNYDALATIEDGSCFFVGDACDDGLVETSNDVILSDCSCEGVVVEVLGCTSTTACNYNAAATADDGTCYFPGDNCDDNDVNTVNDIYTANCLCQGEPVELIEGCTALDACNYNSAANVEDGSCIFPGDVCDDNDATTDLDVIGDDCVCAGLLLGCTFPDAVNYNPAAIIDDGSCEFNIYGCTDPLAVNYDAQANIEDGSCIYSLSGCTDATACNYNPVANVEDGSCTYPGCTDSAACNYDATASCSDTSCEYPIEVYLDCAGNCLNDVNSNGVCDELDAQGCTDPTALNYDPIAIIDNGSCVFIVLGCTNSEACNYNAIANTDDGSCTLPGCNDPEACNFDPQAGCYDGNCDYPFNNYDCNGNCLNDSNSNGICDEYEIYGCTDETAINYNGDATSDDGSCQYDGCTDMTACNYDDTADVDDGSCVYPGCTDANACNYEPTAGCTEEALCTYPAANYLDCSGNCLNDGNSNGICDELDSEGCLDPTADNYNPNATIEDGSCVYLGCTDIAACNYDVTALDDDGSCVYPGCTDVAACNYNAAAGCDDGSCTFAGCTDVAACNYDATAACDNGSCAFPGCNDAAACNYDEAAGCLSEGSCIYPDFAYDCFGNCLNDGNNNGICDEFDNQGCTDATADNYNPNALEDDGSCIYVGCTDATACNYDVTAIDDDGTCTYPSETCLDCAGACIQDNDADGTCDCLEIEGCTNPASVNYNPLATEFDGSCILGCMDVFAINYNAQANEDDGSCIYQILGCTYPTACNYNPEATTDNNTCTFPGCNDFAACNYDPAAGCLLEGSCEYLDENNNGQCDLYEINGCTNADACNYNPAATFDDGSCAFDTQETIQVEAGNQYEWNGTTYTESGTYEFTYTSAAGCDSVVVLNLTITSIFEVDANDLQVWPNPANQQVQVTMNGVAAETIEVFDVAGKHVATYTRKTRLDVSGWAAGSYMLRVRNEQAVIERRLMVVR